ncbi:MAG: hypothetical protein HRU78_09665 [Gammaproteobacteria bacterium]|nr:MAG: hypothetical protein HRU78_09665 [Gammaproteobacteria bacterium]
MQLSTLAKSWNGLDPFEKTAIEILEAYQKSQKSQEKPSQVPETSQAQQILQQKISDALPHDLDHPESLETHEQEKSAQEREKQEQLSLENPLDTNHSKN